MADQLNFPDELQNINPERPERVSKVDLDLIQHNKKQVLFGTTSKDVVELWVYNSDGTLAGHINLPPTDVAVSHTTLVDNTGAYEMANIDLTSIVRRIELQPGHYELVVNFFRNEIGSEDGGKLYISEISNDRTELRLVPVKSTTEILSEIYEFTTPSVPKLYAQALIDQSMNFSLDALDDETLSAARIDIELDTLTPGTTDRLKYASMYHIYSNMIKTIVERARNETLDLMASDVNNQSVQQSELETYIITALTNVITSMRDRNEVDPRIIIV